MPLLAALRVLCTATLRTLHNRMKVALNIISLFRLIVLYDDLTFGQRSYITFRFSCFLVPMYSPALWDMITNNKEISQEV